MDCKYKRRHVFFELITNSLGFTKTKSTKSTKSSKWNWQWSWFSSMLLQPSMLFDQSDLDFWDFIVTTMQPMMNKPASNENKNWLNWSQMLNRKIHSMHWWMPLHQKLPNKTNKIWDTLSTTSVLFRLKGFSCLPNRPLKRPLKPYSIGHYAPCLSSKCVISS